MAPVTPRIAAQRDHSARLHELAERLLERLRAARVEPAERDEDGERRHDDQQQRQRHAEDVDVLQPGQQVERERQRAEEAAERDEREHAQAELAADQPAQVEAAVRGRLGQLVARRARGAHTASRRRSSPTWRRAIGTSAPSAITSTAVPLSCGRTSTARRRLTR